MACLIMRDFVIGIGAICAVTASTVALVAYGFVHDDNFSNPEYTACRHRGGAYQDCIHYVRDEGKKS